MGLRFRSEFDTLQDSYYKVEIHDTETDTYGSDLFTNPNFNGVSSGTEAVSTLAVGDLYEGGVVFYIDDADNKVYICALYDTYISYPSQTHFNWGCNGTSISGADGTAIGTGQANTAAILANCSESPTAATSTQWVDNGYGDWFLPSEDEMKEVYDNKAAIEAAAGVTDFEDEYYWTSSEFSTTQTRAVFMGGGVVIAAGKASTLKIRAIRVTSKPFGPFITYGTPTTAEIIVSGQSQFVNQYSYLNLITNSSDEGVRFDFNATDTKTYELELSVFGDKGSIYIQGATSGTVYAGETNLDGENRISIQATSTEVIRVFFRANNNSVSGGATIYKNIRVREVLIPVIDFTLRGKDGFKLSYTGGETTYDLIKPSNLHFTMNVDNELTASLASNIASSEPERFGVRIYRADMYSSNISDKTAMYQLMWFGYINKRVMSIQDLPFPYDLNIAAVDGILDLKKKDYKDADGNNFYSKKSILEILSQVVTKIDVQDVYNPDYTQAILTRVNWFEDSMTSSLIDPCEEAWVFVDQFTTLNSDNKVQFSSYYDVLNAICRLFQCRFLMSDGRFTFMQFNSLDDGTLKTFLYTSLGSSSGAFPALDGTGGQYTLSQNAMWGEQPIFKTSLDTFNAKMGFFSRTKSFGKKITNVKIPFDASTDFGNILPTNNLFPDWGSVGGGFGGPGVVHIGQDLLGSWEDGDNISFEFTLKFNLLSLSQYGVANSTPDPYNDMNAKVYLPIWLKAKAVDGSGETDKYWQPQDDSGVAIDLNPSNPISIQGDWVEVGSDLVDSAVIIKSDSIYISNGASAGANVSDTIEVTFTTTLANDHDFEGLYLYCDGVSSWRPCPSGSCSGTGGGVNAFWGLETQVGAGAGDVYDTVDWEGYYTSITCNEISLKVFSNGEQYLDTTTQSYVGSFIDDNQNNPQSLEINDIMWGDSTGGDTVMPIKSINIGTSADNTTQSNSWQLDYSGTSGTIHRFISDDILNNNYLSAEVLQARILYPTNYKDATYRVRPEMGYSRFFTDTDGGDTYEEYAFQSLTFSPNKGEWAFKGRKIGLPLPTVVSSTITNQSGTITSSVSPTITGAITQDTNNQLVVTTAAISPSAGAITSISCTELPYALVSGTVIQMQSSDVSASWFTVTLNGDHAENATTLTILSFTPTLPFNVGTPLMVTSGSLIGASAGGADTEVQYNDNGVFAGDSSFTYNESSGKVTATGFIGALEGNADTATLATSATTAATATNAANVTATIASAVAATTQTAGNNTTAVATTAFVTAAVAAGGGGGGTPDGSDTQIQWNNAGAFGANANLTFNDSTNLFKLTGKAEIGDAACDATGTFAVAVNNSTTASSKDAFACGELTTASGRQSFAGGYDTLASGDASFSLGAMSTASGERSVATGEQTVASAENCASFGEFSEATGIASFAANFHTEASGTAAAAFGSHTTASGEYSFVAGGSSTASGEGSTAFGKVNLAEPSYSFAIGQSNQVRTTHSKGVNGFVSGYGNLCTSDNGFVVGTQNSDTTTVTGNNVNQFLIGDNLKTPYNAISNVAMGQCQLVVGRFNDPEQTTHNLFTIGDGTADAARSNALCVNIAGYVGIGVAAPAHQLEISGTAGKPSTNTWVITSDARVKENIQPYEKGLKDIVKLKPKTYDYNGKAGFDKNVKGNIGILAHECKEAFPETVGTYKTKLDKRDKQETELYNFDSHALTFALINAVKELNQEILDLKEQITDSKNSKK